MPPLRRRRALTPRLRGPSGSRCGVQLPAQRARQPTSHLATGGRGSRGDTAMWRLAGEERSFADRFHGRVGVGRWELGAPAVLRMDLEGNPSPRKDRVESASATMRSRPRTRRRSKALKPTQPSAATGAPPSKGDGARVVPQTARQRQEGNGRGDAVRLSTGNILRGVRCAPRGSRDRTDPPSPAGSGRHEQETRRTS
jgi:hypothetical protein